MAARYGYSLQHLLMIFRKAIEGQAGAIETSISESTTKLVPDTELFVGMCFKSEPEVHCHPMVFTIGATSGHPDPPIGVSWVSAAALGSPSLGKPG